METGAPVGQRRHGRPWRIAVYGTVAIWVLFVLLKQCNFDLFTMSLRKNPWAMSSCDKDVRASAESPDRTRKAIMVDFACGGFGAAGVFTSVAVVKLAEQPSEKDEVLGASHIYGEYRDVTKLDWKSDRRLQITLPKGVELYNLKTIHNNIAIEITYDAARAQ